MIDERTEHLISRRLDGELTPEESLELDKLLIRSPEARRAMEEADEIDALTVGTLRTLISHHEQSQWQPAASAARRRGPRLLQYGVGLAAAVLFMMVSTPLLTGGREAGLRGTEGRNLDRAGMLPVSPLMPAAFEQDPAVTRLLSGPRQHRERIDEAIIGILDPETQNVYLLEIETARDTISRMTANY